MQTRERRVSQNVSGAVGDVKKRACVLPDVYPAAFFCYNGTGADSGSDSDKESGMKVLEPKEKKGLTVVFTGDGKGKTSAALGIVLRAVGHGLRICMVQFIKDNLYSGEIDGFGRLGPDVELIRAGRGYVFKQGAGVPKAHRDEAQKGIRTAGEKMQSGAFDILILDEINVAVALGLVDLAQVLELIERKPPLLHLVLTGRGADPAVIEKADTVTEMKELKHAYRQGIEPQKGIDY
jgi:cob(I)alamin adenosyltransferase